MGIRIMRAHVITNGKVTNTIEVAALDFMPGLVDASNGGKMGDSYADGVFIAPEPVVVIPESVSMAQARKALRMSGITSANVVSAINAIPDVMARDLALIDWEFEGRVRRLSPLVQSLGPALGLTDAQIDALFVAASSL